MITDVLSEAIDDINSFLDSSAYGHIYQGELLERILALRAQIEAVRAEPPDEAYLAALRR